MQKTQRLTVKSWVLKSAKLLIPVSAALMLSACGQPTTTVNPDKAAAIDPSILAPSKEQTADIQLLASKGVKVFQVGGSMMMVMSADRVFHPNSANLNPDYLSTLDTVASFMSTYDKEDVRVQAFTDNIATSKISKALSTRQAQVLINYLWSKGTDTRLMYANGVGHLSPVAANNSIWGMQQNRRVVIEFKFYPKVNGWG